MQILYLSNGEKSFKVREIGTQNSFEVEMGDPLIAIGAYCLMPNHFHILIKPLVENGVSTFMKKLSTSYSMYFNKRYERTGSLFEGKFKSQHVDSDEYLKYLFSYIHLNPLKLLDPDWKEKGLGNILGGEKYLDEYRFSSYQDFQKGNRNESTILDVTKFPEYFPSRDSFLKEIKEWMSYREFV
jgi:putative transposase